MSKLGPTQLADVLRQLPRSTNPNLLVGFETNDDAGVFRLSDTQALVQTVDFFTPIVDDPYAYGQIAAANALSDIYAMGGRPLTVLNIACFDPALAPADVWAAVLKGMLDKTTEAGAVVLGGHSVIDPEPKFGMAVTGLIDPQHVFANTDARVGDYVCLSKPLGTGIVATAAKGDLCTADEYAAMVASMSALNREASLLGLENGVRCATDITGYGLAGHLWNVARASSVRIELLASSLPLLPGVERLVELGCTTGGAANNRAFVGDDLEVGASVSPWLQEVAIDPQTSGGLALFSTEPLPEMPVIGRVVTGAAKIALI